MTAHLSRLREPAPKRPLVPAFGYCPRWNHFLVENGFLLWNHSHTAMHELLGNSFIYKCWRYAQWPHPNRGHIGQFLSTVPQNTPIRTSIFCVLYDPIKRKLNYCTVFAHRFKNWYLSSTNTLCAAHLAGTRCLSALLIKEGALEMNAE